MKAIILAAGVGVRLRPLTSNTPKCLLRIGKKTLIEHSLRNIMDAGLEEVIIVTGYLSHRIEETVCCLNLPLKINFIKNDSFENTGSMYSLYIARHLIDDDIILFESDLIYDPPAIQIVLDSKYDTGFLVTSQSYSGDEVYICIDTQNRVIDLGKKLSDEKRRKAIGELVGISRYSLEFLKQLFLFTEKRIQNGQLTDHYEETTFLNSINGLPVFAIFQPKLNWIEIDKYDDFYRAKNFIYPNIRGKNMKIIRKILLNPGPATTTDSVKLAQIVSDICPREQEFGDIMRSIQNDLTKIAGGDETYTTVLIVGSGTAGLEATVSSVVPKDTKLLVINNGAYGQRLLDIASTYGISTVELKYEIGISPDSKELERILEKDSSISCVAMVHHETTTGLLNPLREVGITVKKFNKIFILDAMSSFAGIPFSVKEENVDFMISSSNKCIQGMPGCSFIISKISELEKCKGNNRSYYFDLQAQYEHMNKFHQLRFTPPVQVLYALRKAIDELFEEGAKERHRRYYENWRTLTSGMKKLGFELFLPDVPQSHLLTTFYEPEHPNFSFGKFHDLLYERGFTIYPGKLVEANTFRVANIGAISKTDIENYLENLREVFEEMGLNLN